jgi:hypothetical protein
MKRVISIVGLLIVVVGIALLGHQPAPANAGGFPCFMCHGVNFEGSDIAPTVAGTKLTDEQIANQMRHPRGVMPAFDARDWPDPQTAISYIRAQPTGKPTMALSPQQRSAALALIAGVAAARATAVLQTESSSATVVATPSPSPAATIPSVSNSPTSSASNSDLPLGILVSSGLLLTMIGAVWMWQRR